MTERAWREALEDMGVLAQAEDELTASMAQLLEDPFSPVAQHQLQLQQVLASRQLADANGAAHRIRTGYETVEYEEE